MITGTKPAALVEPHEEIRSSRSLAAIALFALVVAALVAALQLAPTGTDRGFGLLKAGRRRRGTRIFSPEPL